MSFWVK